jgi:hypothetical protein
MLGSGEKLARHCFNCRKKETDRIAQKKMDAAVRGKPPSHFLKFWFPLETQDCATVVWTSAPRNSPMPLAGPCLLDAMSVETREGLELPRSARKHIRRRSITQRIFLKMESSTTMKATASISMNAFLTSLTIHRYSRRPPRHITASPDGLKCIKKFLAACMSLKREACPSCRGIDWDMRIWEGKCHRCRRDKDIRSFGNENLTNPGRCSIQLFALLTNRCVSS